MNCKITRKGKKNQPFFRVVVVDKKRSSKGGRSVEEVGYVDPMTKRKSLHKDRILYWIKNGAQPSSTVHNLLVLEKIIDAPKIKKFSVTKKAKAEAVKSAQDAKVAEQEKTVVSATNVSSETSAQIPQEKNKEESLPVNQPSEENKSEAPIEKTS
jgi:small subunit ribosomal protein S16